MFFNSISLFLLTLFMGVLVDKYNRHKLLFLLQILFAVQALPAYIILGFINNIHLTMVVMFFVGVGLTCVTSPQNILLQNIADEEKRGRVMSINTLCYMGTISLSSYFCGILTHYFGIKDTFIILGIIMLIIGSFLSYNLSKFSYGK